MLTDLDYELLSAYIDGTLSDDERTAFELRLRNEPELRSELDEIRATVTLLNNLPTLKAPRDFTLDARYSRRNSIFLTSAVFSALSTAAAVVLFALGAYLFLGDKSPAQPTTSSQAQGAQFAFVPTTTGPASDETSAFYGTATDLALDKTSANEAQLVLATTTPTLIAATDSGTLGGLAADGVTQPTDTEEPTLAPQGFLFQRRATATVDSDTANNGGGALPDEEGRTSEATMTAEEDFSASSAAAAPASAPDVAPLIVPQAEATTDNVPAPAPMSQAQQAPLMMTAVPTATALPTETVTELPTATSTETLSPTATDTPQATVTPAPIVPAPAANNTLSVLLIGLGVILLVIGIVTTIIRRRNRL